MLPTPTAQDGQNEMFPPSQRNRKSLVGKMMDSLIPTPTARCVNPGSKTDRPDGQPSRDSELNHFIAMLPTPNASDAKGGGSGETDYAQKHAMDRLKYTASTGNLPMPTEHMTLDAIIQTVRDEMLPTPAAGDGHKTTQNTRQRNLNWLAPVGTNSHLSPLFVEEMMGFPRGWTVLPFLGGDEKA